MIFFLPSTTLEETEEITQVLFPFLSHFFLVVSFLHCQHLENEHTPWLHSAHICFWFWIAFKYHYHQPFPSLKPVGTMTIEYYLLVLAGTIQDDRARLETLVRVILPLLALKCVERCENRWLFSTMYFSCYPACHSFLSFKSNTFYRCILVLIFPRTKLSLSLYSLISFYYLIKLSISIKHH